MPHVEVAIDVAAPARDVYELAKDQERFPEFMPDVESVTVLERRGDAIVTRWKTLVEEAPIEWTEEDRFDDCGGGTARVVLSVEYDFGVPTLAELIGPTLQRKVQENSEMMLQGLKREAEALAAKRQEAAS